MLVLANSLTKTVKTKNILVLIDDVTAKQTLVIFEDRRREQQKLIVSDVPKSFPKISGPIWSKDICNTPVPQLSILNHTLFSSHCLINTVKKIPWKETPQIRQNAVQQSDYRTKYWCLSLISDRYNIVQPITYRCFHSSSVFSKKDSEGNEIDSKPSSKVEEAVKAIEEKQKTAVVEPKRSLGKRILDELVHYYHGFRLLFIDIKISVGLVWRILKGKTLSRREHRQLVRTTSDVFRLLPFSVFIIVPFMELLLPLFLKLFPGMLPSTFQTKTEKKSKMKAQLKVKLDMAKFLQQTLDEMAPESTGRKSTLAKEFAQFIDKIHKTGAEVTNEEIMKFSKLFEDEITLDSLSRPQLMALCRVLDISAFGNTTMLRFQLKMRLRNLLADDKVIKKEGINKLTYQELQSACKARGMRALGVPEDRLRRQLEHWIQLSIDDHVPPSLLLLSRTMYLSENVPEEEQLKATLSALPDAAAIQTKGAIGEREGRVDNKVRIEILKEEERRIREEREETEPKEVVEEPMSSLLGPDGPPMMIVSDVIEKVLNRKVPKPDRPIQADGVTSADLEIIEDAIDKLGDAKKSLYIEKEELEDLKQEIKDYNEDVDELKTLTEKTPGAEVKVKESKGAHLLLKKLSGMIEEIDGEIKSKDVSKDDQEQLITTEEIMNAIKVYQKDPERLKYISGLLQQLDEDKDGKIEVDDIVKLTELIGRENITLNQKQLEECVRLINKEDLLEVEVKGKEKIIRKRTPPQANAKGAKQ